MKPPFVYKFDTLIARLKMSLVAYGNSSDSEEDISDDVEQKEELTKQ